MKRNYLLLPLFTLLSALAWTDAGYGDQDVQGQFPNLHFIPNLGQWEGPHSFEASLGISKLFTEKHALTYLLIDEKNNPVHHHPNEAFDSDARIKAHAYKVAFDGALESTEVIGKKPKETYNNYYLGSDASKWHSHVPLYNYVLYRDLYQGIDMKVYQSNGALKYDFIVYPGHNAADIKMTYNGVDNIKIKNGELIIETSIGTVIEKKPYAYQYLGDEKVVVPCSFKLNKNSVTFSFPKGYNTAFELIIDPVLVFSTYTGSTSSNFGASAAFDSGGNGFAAGIAYGPGYPTTFGAFDISYNDPNIGAIEGGVDVSISKFNSTGTGLIYSTYLGGNQRDIPHSLIVNSNDELIVFGSTSSGNFPTSPGAYDNLFNGGNMFNPNGQLFNNGSDIFISAFASDGSALIGSTFIGGSRNDGVNDDPDLVVNYADQFRGEVIVDDADNIYVASTTTSTDFPTTPGAFSETHNGGTYDGIILKFNSNLSNLLWSTYFGGSGNDVAYSMKIDGSGDLYFAGGTTSSNIPTTANAEGPSYHGGISDGFLGKFNNNGSALLASTYMGTSGPDQCYFIEVDPEDQVYVLGDARSGNYPITSGRYSIPGSTHFIHKMKPNLDSTFFSTVIGSGFTSGVLALNAFMIDDCYRIYLSGWGGTTNTLDPMSPSTTSVLGFPTTSDAFQSVTDGSDFYFLVLKPNVSDIQYGTFFGGVQDFDGGVGEHVDGGTSRFDRRGIIYQAICAGCRGQSDLPVSGTAYATRNGMEGQTGQGTFGSCNQALVKFDFQLDEIVVNASVTPALSGCAPFDVQFTNFSRGPIDIYEWTFGDGTVSDEVSPRHTYDVGTHQVMLIGLSEFACVDPDTAFLTIEVVDPDETTNEVMSKCAEDPLTLESKHIMVGADYEWQDGTTSSSITVIDPGIYYVKTISGAGCFVDSFQINNFPIPSSSVPVEGCEPEDYVLGPPDINPPLQFLWQDGSTGTSLTARDAGIYWVQTLDPNNCDRIDSFIIDEYPLKDPIVERFDLCPGKTTTLRASDTSPGLTHLWSDGTTSEQITIDGPGTYIVVTTYPDECPLTDSFIVMADTINPITLDSIRICEDDNFVLSSKQVQDGATYIWNTGETTPTIEVGESGLFEVVTDFNRVCPYTNRYAVQAFPVIDENDIYFPNAFSPNNDGINETFRPYFSDLVIVLGYELHIFNRWGQKVFESYNQNIGWDGVDFNQPEAVAVYAYYSLINLVSCRGEPLQVMIEGDITLMK